jgi:hypothetical protein
MPPGHGEKGQENQLEGSVLGFIAGPVLSFSEGLRHGPPVEGDVGPLG